MTITKLISELNKVYETHGDLTVMCGVDEPIPYFWEAHKVFPLKHIAREEVRVAITNHQDVILQTTCPE